jgi:multiple sugar transport system ATP-binding protein
MMGNEKLLHVVAGPHRLLARVDLRTQARPGQDIDLTVDIERLHIFDAETQLALDIAQVPEEVRSSSLARIRASDAAAAVNVPP